MTSEPPAMWDREPIMVRWQVRTWEHAALDPQSHGLTRWVRESRRLLPAALTAPIYARLAEAEALIIRLTEPLPPFDARLLRDIDTEISNGDEGGEPMTLSGRVSRLLAGRFTDIVPNWSAKVTAALGTDAANVERDAQSVANVGIPRDDFSIQYGYRLDFSLIQGHHTDAKVTTLRSLLMGCQESPFPPGRMRDVCESLMR